MEAPEGGDNSDTSTTPEIATQLMRVSPLVNEAWT